MVHTDTTSGTTRYWPRFIFFTSFPANSHASEVHVRFQLSSIAVWLVIVCAVLSLSACGGSGSSSPNSGGNSINIAAFPMQIGAGANWQFTANVAGSSGDPAVNWSVNPTNGGTIDGSGLYIAPTTGSFPMTVTVSASSQSNSSLTTSASITITQTDPLGAAQATPTNCPTFQAGLTGSTCYQVNTSCPGVADFSVYLKVNQPSGTPLGTVMFGTGTGGGTLYDDDPLFDVNGTNGGLAVVQGVLNAGFTTVQVSFGSPFNGNSPNGWLTGPGGVRRLACRYATVAQWVYQNIHNSNTNAPLCATGNSGGSGAIAYALTDYGLSSIFSMVEETSGPPMSRLDKACVPTSSCETQTFNCNGVQQTLPVCYSTDDSKIIDPAYSQPVCTNAINGATPPSGLFLSDSILGGTSPVSFPKTRVNQVFGGLDQSAAVEQGVTWYNAVNGTKAQSCVSDAPHPIPSVQDGASTIATDIQNLCRLQ
jgi:hypothetical protein